MFKVQQHSVATAQVMDVVISQEHGSYGVSCICRIPVAAVVI